MFQFYPTTLVYFFSAETSTSWSLDKTNFSDSEIPEKFEFIREIPNAEVLANTSVQSQECSYIHLDVPSTSGTALENSGQSSLSCLDYLKDERSISTEDYNFYLNNFDVGALKSSQDKDLESDESSVDNDVILFRRVESKAKEKIHTFSKFNNTYLSKINYVPLTNDFLENISLIRKILSSEKIKLNKEFDEVNKIHFKKLIKNIRTEQETNQRIYQDDTDIIKNINKIISGKYNYIIKLINSVELNYKNSQGSYERTFFNKKLRVIHSSIKCSIKILFSDSMIEKVNLKKYIFLEVNKFIDKYKYLPEVLNVKIFLCLRALESEKLFLIYVMIRTMNIVLSSKFTEDMHNTLALLYHSTLQACNARVMTTRCYISHRYVSDSICGNILLSLDLLNKREKCTLSLRLKTTSLSRIEGVLLKNKNATFSLFLTMNIHLFVKCLDVGTDGDFGNYKSLTYISEQLKHLEKVFNEYIDKYPQYSTNYILKCSILIYNYLIYGNVYE